MDKINKKSLPVKKSRQAKAGRKNAANPIIPGVPWHG
jgi:hypothetical protein